MIVLNYSATDPESIIANTSLAASPTLTSLASYRVRTSTTFEPASTYAEITNTPAATLVGVPASSGVSHIIDGIIIHNADNITHDLIVQWTDGTNFATIWEGELLASESVEYAEGAGWIHYDVNGSVKIYNTLTFTGDATGTGSGTIALTIPANTVTNAKAAQMATMTIKGNDTAVTANAQDLTVDEVVTMINGRMLAQTKGYNLI